MLNTLKPKTQVDLVKPVVAIALFNLESPFFENREVRKVGTDNDDDDNNDESNRKLLQDPNPNTSFSTFESLVKPTSFRKFSTNTTHSSSSSSSLESSLLMPISKISDSQEHSSSRDSDQSSIFSLKGILKKGERSRFYN